MLKHSRERERWMVDAIGALVQHTNREWKKVNPEVVDGKSVPNRQRPMRIDNFDMGKADFADEDFLPGNNYKDVVV